MKNKKINTILLILEVIVIIFLAIFYGFKLLQNTNNNQNENIIETYTKQSQYFYKINQICYFDEHIFCLNSERNSITVLDKNGNCKKEIKFKDTDGHVAIDMIMLNDNLYVIYDIENIILKYDKWNSYQEKILNEEEISKYVDLYLDMYDNGEDTEKLKKANIDKNSFYEVNKQGTKLFKIEGNDKVLLKESDPISSAISINIEFILIFIVMIIQVLRSFLIKKVENQ